MKRLIILLLMFPLYVFAHGGEGHGDKPKKAAAGAVATYFTSIANSDKYELLLKYTALKPGEPSVFRLFISGFDSNTPINDATIGIQALEDAQLKFEVKKVDIGTYEIKTKFPEKKAYSLTVNLNSTYGPDLMVLQNIDVGKELPHAEDSATAKNGFNVSSILLVGGGSVLGALLVLMILGILNRKIKPKHTIIAILFSTVPFSAGQLSAHGGEEHGDEGKSNTQGQLSDAFIIPKESQFLFEVLTEKIATRSFANTSEFLGTVVPSATGLAVIQSPQTGRIVSLKVNVGQQVKQGQVLAVIEQTIDAGTQVNLLAEKNAVDAEYEAAKKQYERLQSIEDIAAKKDVLEAEARFRKAKDNKQLFNNLGTSRGGDSKLLALKAPVSGIVSPFNYAIGSVVNAGETIFSITNLSKVYVEAQVYGNSLDNMNENVKVFGRRSNDTTQLVLKLLSKSQTVNADNQSQRYIFELINPSQAVKIGENITVSIRSSASASLITVPNTAITEVNGKPALFIKDEPEHYNISYVQKGATDGKRTVIVKGVEQGERVVTNGTYQMKTMYLNQ